MSVIQNSGIATVLGHVAAGNTVQTTSIVDMQGYEKVVFMVNLGTLTTLQTAGTIQINGGNAADGSDMAALVGALITIADGDASKTELIEVVKPTNMRYVEAVITRNSQAAEILSVNCWQFGLHKQPITALGSNIAQALVAIDPEVSTSGVTTSSGTYGSSPVTVVTTYRNAS